MIVTAGGLNHTVSKSVVAAVPSGYLEHVDVIEFVPAGSLAWRGTQAYGLAMVRWGAWHDCYDVRIQLACNDRAYCMPLLWHELGHVDELCRLKLDDSSEEYAEGFFCQEFPRYCS